MKDVHTFVILAYNESDDLEDCIKSVLNQSVKSNVVIATSTKNDFIIDLASQYGLGVMVNDRKSNKGSDYNFAIDAFDTLLVTIAHQDDIYDRNYVKEIIKYYKNNFDASIIFTDYYEIYDDKKIKSSNEIKNKHFLVKPLKYKCFQDKKYFKMRSLKYKQSFCTSSVTFVRTNINNDFFPTDLVYNNDWLGFINLAQKNSRFVYLDKKLVGYRLCLKDDYVNRFEEDRMIYQKIWPIWLVDCFFRKNKKEKNNEEKVE